MIGIRRVLLISFLLMSSVNLFAQKINFKTIDKGLKPIMRMVDDEPKISYVLENGSAGEVKLATYISANKGFSTEKLETFNLYGPAIIDVFDDNLYMCFHNHGLNGGGLNVLYEDGNNWLSMDASNEGHDGWDSDIKVLTENKIFTSSIDAIPFNGLGLEFSSFNGSSWTVDTVGTTTMNYGYGTSLEIDGTEKPHIFYFNSTSGALEYASKESATWNIDTIDSVGVTGYYPVSVIKNDTLIVAYLQKITANKAAVKLAVETVTGHWVITAIDTISDYDFSLMGRRPLDIYQGDSLHVVVTSSKKMIEYAFDEKYIKAYSNVVLEVKNQDSVLVQMTSFEKDESGFKHFCTALKINGEENIYYGTNRTGFYSALDLWSAIKVYPNPVENYMNISGVGGVASLYDSRGVEVLEIDLDYDNNVNMSFLSPGIYYLKSNNYYAKILKK